MRFNYKTIAYSKLKFAFRCFLPFICLFILSCTQNNRFQLLDGTLDKLENYHGSWLLVNFWANWCQPCKEEVPELNELFLEAKSINLKILSISYEPVSNQDLAELVKSWGISYPVVATEPVPILTFSLPNKLPSHYLISPDGELVQNITGKQTRKSLKAVLKQAKKDYKNKS